MDRRRLVGTVAAPRRPGRAGTPARRRARPGLGRRHARAVRAAPRQALPLRRRRHELHRLPRRRGRRAHPGDPIGDESALPALVEDFDALRRAPRLGARRARCHGPERLGAVARRRACAPHYHGRRGGRRYRPPSRSRVVRSARFGSPYARLEREGYSAEVACEPARWTRRSRAQIEPRSPPASGGATGARHGYSMAFAGAAVDHGARRHSTSSRSDADGRPARVPALRRRARGSARSRSRSMRRRAMPRRTASTSS